MGGGYAVSARALAALTTGGHLSDPLAWLWTPCSEDIVVTLCVTALGQRASDLNGDGEPFGVQAVGLADTPERLVERGYGIIHSVKDHGDRRETETRAFFRARRAGTAVAPAAEPVSA